MTLVRPLALLVLVAVGVACSSSDHPAPMGTGSGGWGATGGSGGSTAGSGGSAGSAGQDGGAGGTAGMAGAAGTGGEGGTTDNDAGQDADVDGPMDAPFDIPPLDVVTVVDTCPSAPVAVGSKDMLIGGNPNAPFATAYAAELSSMTYPGPLLLVFQGIDTNDPSGWTLQVGGLQAAGSNVAFVGTPAELPFSLGENRSLYAAKAAVSMIMHFATPTTQADVPVIEIGLTGSFDTSCTTLSLETLSVAIPASAASVAFHGSTLGALLGTPNYVVDGGKDAGGEQDAWIVGLIGSGSTVSLQ